MARCSVPFTNDDAFAGFGETEGILKFDGEQFEMQFRIADTFVGILKTDVKTIAFPLDSIQDVEFKKRFFSRKLFLRFSDLETSAKVPGCKSGEVDLDIKKKNLSRAIDLVTQVQLDLAELSLRRVKGDSEYE